MQIVDRINVVEAMSLTCRARRRACVVGGRDVGTQLTEVPILFQHYYKRGKTEHQAGKTKALHYTRGQSQPVENLVSSPASLHVSPFNRPAVSQNGEACCRSPGSQQNVSATRQAFGRTGRDLYSPQGNLPLSQLNYFLCRLESSVV